MADREVINRKNLALPDGQKLALPEMENTKQIEFKDLMKLEAEHNPEKTVAAYESGMSGIKDILKR